MNIWTLEGKREIATEKGSHGGETGFGIIKFSSFSVSKAIAYCAEL